MTRNRINVLKHFVIGNRNGVTIGELTKHIFDAPYSLKAKKCITRIEKTNDDILIFLRGIKTPLYYPKSFSTTSLKQVIVESFYADNWHYYEVPQTKVQVDDIVVDCGAAEGLFGLLVSKRCKQLYLIEPLPIFNEVLRKTFANNDDVKILMCGLSDKESNLKMSENEICSSIISNGKGIDVKMTTLDKLFYENKIPVSYLKIDLEGYDYIALKGAKNLIIQNQPKIAITTYHKHEHVNEITEFLKSIAPKYKIITKGIYQETGCPVMLHAWI